jgi:hypothetical protein
MMVLMGATCQLDPLRACCGFSQKLRWRWLIAEDGNRANESQ